VAEVLRKNYPAEAATRGKAVAGIKTIYENRVGGV